MAQHLDGGTTEYDLSRPSSAAIPLSMFLPLSKANPQSELQSPLWTCSLRQVLHWVDEWLERLVPRVWFVVEVDVDEILAAVSGPRTPGRNQ